MNVQNSTASSSGQNNTRTMQDHSTRLRELLANTEANAAASKRVAVPMSQVDNYKEALLVLEQASKEDADAQKSNDSYGVLQVQQALLHQHINEATHDDKEFYVYTDDHSGAPVFSIMNSAQVWNYKP